MNVETVTSSSKLQSPSRTRGAARQLTAVFTAIIVIAVCACASSGSASHKNQPGKNLELTPGQLQIKVRGLADPLSGIIEEVVWDLSRTDDDPAWLQNLLVWQINVVNAVQRATFQPVPLAALFDTWALVEQLRDYAESRRDFNTTEKQVRIILAGVDRMDALVWKIAVDAGGEEGAANTHRLIRDWVDEHPIDRFATRASTESELAHWTARGNMSAMATVKSLGASLDDVMARLDLYSEYIPKQASWHAQAVTYDWLAPRQTDGVFADLTKTAVAFDRIATSLEGYPDVVSDERRIVLETVQDERAIILEHLLAKFAEIQQFINEERIDLVENQLRIEREAVFDAIAAERAIIITEAKQERADTMVELEQMVDGLVESTATRVVDHAFLRALQLMAVFLVGLGLIAVVVVMLWKHK